MRITARLVLVLALVALAGCSESHILTAYVDPPNGHVPYDAEIVCSQLPGTYTYELPDGTSVTSREPRLAVTIDRLAWTARVIWTSGDEVRVAEVEAHGTNATPEILAPRINGDAYTSQLRPREATLLDFTHYAAGLSGPESGVAYDGPWRLVSIRVEAEEKVVCDVAMPDSVYTPPWESGVYHALFHGQVWDNACLVYPLYTAETAPNGLPYPPQAMTGYTLDGARNRNCLLGVEFPEQTAVIRVVVEDEWGRQTSASFSFPVAATSSWEYVDPEDPSPPPHADITAFESAVFFVGSRSEKVYHRRSCDSVCAIPASDRLYFASETNAEAAGMERARDCFEGE